MDRISINWMNTYYNVLDSDGDKIGEVYYGIVSRKYHYHPHENTCLTSNQMKQITKFIDTQNSSNNSYV